MHGSQSISDHFKTLLGLQPRAGGVCQLPEDLHSGDSTSLAAHMVCLKALGLTLAQHHLQASLCAHTGRSAASQPCRQHAEPFSRRCTSALPARLPGVMWQRPSIMKHSCAVATPASSQRGATSSAAQRRGSSQVGVLRLATGVLSAQRPASALQLHGCVQQQVAMAVGCPPGMQHSMSCEAPTLHSTLRRSSQQAASCSGTGSRHQGRSTHLRRTGQRLLTDSTSWPAPCSSTLLQPLD